MLSVSATTPWPAKAASPWSATGRTVKSVPPLLMMSCLARAMPSRTGSTASRCEGLAASETLICSPSRPVKVPSAPRWYLTSPEPCIERGSRLPSNSRKICAYDLPTMFARTFSRPRWAMPMTTSSRRASAAESSTASSSGMTDSPPSSENRFWPTYFVCRNVSNASAAFSRRRMRSCSSRSGFGRGRSTRSWSHLRCFGSWMCMNSMPVVRQYDSRSTPRMSRSFIIVLPANPPTAKSRSRSHRVRPCSVMSRSGCLRWWYSSGSVSAMTWPRTR
ncbi:hypothetical protein EES46_11050 [Streptomyces sp. ADI98-10]|nr:hypothetical protein EES46_11050 [Streptomyces sp. ADI98-10]